MEPKRREKEYWDPLRMCEKGRELMEVELKRQVELELIQKEQLKALENGNNTADGTPNARLKHIGSLSATSVGDETLSSD